MQELQNEQSELDESHLKMDAQITCEKNAFIKIKEHSDNRQEGNEELLRLIAE